MIYRILPELEPFSMTLGGAISKNVANIMRYDGSTVVTSKRADSSWGFSEVRVLVLPSLHIYRRVPGRRFLPLWMHKVILRLVFRPLSSRLLTGDVVWCHNQPFFAAALEGTIHSKGAKLIYHCHDRHANYAVRSAFRSFTADSYIFVSDAMRALWLTRFPRLHNCHTVHNGVDLERFLPSTSFSVEADSGPIVLYVGRLAPEKGVHVLVEAVTLLNKRKVRVACRIVGTSFPGQTRISDYVEWLHRSSSSNIEFIGFLPNSEVADQYQHADIVCCPSVCHDAFPGVPLEAMACGVPVVASRIGGIPEIAVGGGVVLVSPNSAKELADALYELLKNPTARVTLGRQGRAAVEDKFTWPQAVDHYLKIACGLQGTGLQC